MTHAVGIKNDIFLICALLIYLFFIEYYFNCNIVIYVAKNAKIWSGDIFLDKKIFFPRKLTHAIGISTISRLFFSEGDIIFILLALGGGRKFALNEFME